MSLDIEELTCGGTTLVHMVYSRSRKVFCHCSLAGPTASITLSKAASLVKKSTASLSVKATATANKTPKRLNVIAKQGEALDHPCAKGTAKTTPFR